MPVTHVGAGTCVIILEMQHGDGRGLSRERGEREKEREERVCV